MAQQTINVGTVANDGTGDPLRTMGQKANANFTELYSLVSGVLTLKGNTDCSSNPNYPSAVKGDTYYVTVAGKIGGASGKSVDVGDAYICKSATSAGGTEASVGTDWFILEHNLSGVVVQGAVTSSGLTQATNRLLGRTTASTGAIEEITVGSGLSLSGGTLTATAAGGAITSSSYTMTSARMLGRTTASTGAIEEITVGSGLSLSGGTLTATGVAGGAITSSGLTQTTARILGRTTASTGAIEEISIGAGLSLSAGSLATSGAYTASGLTMATARLLGRTTASSGAAEEISVGTGLTLSAGSLTADNANIKPTQSLIIACSDETTALTTGNGKVTFRAPYAFTLSDVRASLTTAQASGSVLTVDVNKNGTTILSTKLTFDNTEKTTTTAATPRVISVSSISDDDEITIDIDQVGTSGATGLKVCLIGTRT